MNYYKPEIYSLTVWRPEVQNRGVRRASLPLKALGEDPSCLFQLLGAPGVPGLVAASLQSASRELLCVCVFSPLIKTPVTGSGSTLLQYNLIFTHHLCKDPVSK